MSARLAGAVALTQRNSDGWFGFEAGSLYSVNAGGEVWFVADPAAVGVTGTSFSVSMTSYHQQNPALTAWAYAVDANSCLVGSKQQLAGDSDWYGFRKIFMPIYGYPAGYPAGQKYLLQVDSNQSTGIAVMWQLY